MVNSKNRLLLFLLLSLIVVSCSSTRPVPPPRTVEMPAKPDYLEFFERGKTAFEIGDFDEAELFLKNSLEISPDYIPSLELLADIYMNRGMNSEALALFEKVVVLNSYSTSARLGIGRIALSEARYQEALDNFMSVIDIEQSNAEAHFYKGVVLKEMDSTYRSITSMIRAIINDGSYRETVNGIYTLNDPEIGKLFQDEFLTIEYKDSVTRADLAGLLATIIRDGRVFSEQMIGPQFTPPSEMVEHPVPEDVPDNHWAADEIASVVKAGLFELFPDNTFKPDTSVNKADFATVLQTLLVRIYNDQSMLTRYVGGSSPYSDLNSAHWAFNAARLTEEMGFLSRRDRNIYGISDSVDGLTAIVALESLNRLK